MTERIDQDNPRKEMSFIEHLEVLRWHIVRSLIAMAVGAVLAFVFKSFIFDELIFGPTKPEFPTFRFICKMTEQFRLGETFCVEGFDFTFINVDMAGQFMVHLKVSIMLGFVLAFPYVFWEFWRFVKPGLYQNEIRQTRGVVFYSSLLFIIGVLFGYYILMPFSVNFFANYAVSEVVNNSFTLTNYVSYITMFVMASGILFELPMVVYFLSKVGLLTPDFMKAHRKQAFIITLLVAAMITPADIGTQLLVTLPIVVLYEISIVICRRVNREIARDLI